MDLVGHHKILNIRIVCSKLFPSAIPAQKLWSPPVALPRTFPELASGRTTAESLKLPITQVILREGAKKTVPR